MEKKHPHASHQATATAAAPAPDSRYRLIFERNPVGFFRTILDGHIQDCNQACANIFGFDSPAELLTHGAEEFYFDLEDRKRVLEMLRRDHAIHNVELRMRKRDGSLVWVLENAILLEGAPGEASVAEGTLIDISELKRSDERLRIENAHLEQLFQNSPEAIATLDNDNRVLRANREFTRMFGFSEQEILGRDINDLIVPVENYQEARRLCDLLHKGEQVNVESVRRRRNGTLVDVSILGTPIRLGTGQMGHYAIYRDISERKHAERLQSALYRIADVATAALDLPELYRSIHAILKELMYAKNCYVALYDEASDMVAFPYFVDEKDPPMPPHKFRKGLTEYVLRTGEALLTTPERLNELARTGEWERMGSPSLDWMGVPLKGVGGKPFGALVVQSYREHVRYGEHEKEILTFVSQQIARAVEGRRHQEAIRESENKFRSLAETAVTAISIYDDERFLYVNPAACTIFGYPVEEMMRMRPFDFVHPDFKAAVEERMRMRLAGKPAPSRYELKVLTRAGEVRWLDFSASQIPFEGRPVIVATAVDITERKRSELLQSALYRIAEKTSAAGDLQEFYAYIHQVVSELMHAENFYIALYDEPTGTVSFSYWVDEVDPPPARKKLEKGLTEYVLRTGRPLLATPDVFEDMVRRGEVESIGAPSLDWLGVPLIIGDKTTGVLVVQTYRENIRYREPEKDILTFVARHVATAIEHKRNQEELRQSETRYRSLVQGAVHGIFRTTLDGKFLAVNSALTKMLGYSSEQELMSVNSSDIYYDPSTRQRLAQEYLPKGRWSGLEVQLKRKDGTPVSVRLSGAFLTDEHGEVRYSEGIIEDITERLVLEQQLRQAQKMEAVGRLAGGVAHDFNNLLTVIKGYTEIVREDLGPSYPHRQELQETLNASERAATLTRQLLAFSRQQVMAPRIVNLNHVVTNMQNLITRLLGEDVHLEIKLAAELGSAKADPSQFEQVIMNLAVNARHAMPNGGKLFIETSNVELEEAWAREHVGARAGRFVLMTISDTGTGMDEKTKARLFEPFFTTKEQGKGTGLGLSTVYGIVKQSGGYISVYSELGSGTTFKIYLPRVDALAETLATAAVPAPANRGSETVLLVEDEEGVRRLVRDLITRQGYKVLEAHSGEEALNVLAKHTGKIDLLLTDLVLSNMSGRELSERLRSERKDLKVIYMSGYTDDALLHAGMLSEGALFIQKPFTATLLAQKMRELLDAQRA